MNPVYLGLGVAIAVMLVAIAWLISTRRVTVSATPAPPPKSRTPLLEQSFEQRVRDHITPTFDDMIDKENAKRVAEALYAAYKGVKIEPKS